jgi:hypothetical protein
MRSGETGSCRDETSRQAGSGHGVFENDPASELVRRRSGTRNDQLSAATALLRNERVVAQAAAACRV